jgi:micrococcal nuclease
MAPMRYSATIALILLYVLPGFCFAENYTVTKIYSGNRIKTRAGVKVQYIGLDVPGDGRFFFDECKMANKNLVDKKEITIEFDFNKRKNNKELLGYVYVGDVFVNARLLKNGFAIAYIQPPNQKYADLFIALQKEARKQRRGIWAFEDPSDEPYYAGSKSSRKFHRPGCRIAKDMSFDKRVVFRNKDEALNKGYAPDWRCNPLFKKHEEKKQWSNQKK